jgi:hypothetical protein
MTGERFGNNEMNDRRALKIDESVAINKSLKHKLPKDFENIVNYIVDYPSQRALKTDNLGLHYFATELEIFTTR